MAVVAIATTVIAYYNKCSAAVKQIHQAGGLMSDKLVEYGYELCDCGVGLIKGIKLVSVC
eukprot:scaffold217799_cov30-Prasinocladus_malaysianus.AAC.1